MSAERSSWDWYNEVSNGVEGWFGDIASSACDAILRRQAQEGIFGDMLEIGAWHGKSALLWLLHARPADTLHVVDIQCREPLEQNLSRAAALAGGQFKLIKSNSLRYPDAEFLTAHRRKLRLVHIDGDHTEAGVANDLAVCTDLLHPIWGVMIVDDFFSYRFPQITEVLYAFLAARRRELAMFACGDNKAFICTAKGFSKWQEFAAASLAAEVATHTPVQGFEGTWEGRPILALRRN